MMSDLVQVYLIQSHFEVRNGVKFHKNNFKKFYEIQSYSFLNIEFQDKKKIKKLDRIL